MPKNLEPTWRTLSLTGYSLDQRTRPILKLFVPSSILYSAWPAPGNKRVFGCTSLLLPMHAELLPWSRQYPGYWRLHGRYSSWQLYDATTWTLDKPWSNLNVSKKFRRELLHNGGSRGTIPPNDHCMTVFKLHWPPSTTSCQHSTQLKTVWPTFSLHRLLVPIQHKCLAELNTKK